MKNNILKLAVVGVISFASLGAFALISNVNKTQTVKSTVKTETFKVYGNCNMCKNRIEDALKNVNGVSKVNWNIESKMMTVTFDQSKITLAQIEQKIADVGHDTDTVKANDKTYSKLPDCCQYERSKTETKSEMKCEAGKCGGGM